MFTRSYLRSCVCVSAIVMAPAAQAEVTAAQVWQVWQDRIAAYSGEADITTGAVDTQDGTVTVTDLVLSQTDEGDSFRVTIPQIVFSDAEGGTVDVTMSDVLPVSVTGADDMQIDLSVTQTGAVITASGTPDQLTYDIAADQYAITLDRLVSEGETLDGDIRFALNGLGGTLSNTTGDLETASYDLRAASVDMLVDITSPEDDKVMVSGKIDGVAMAGSSTAPADLDLSDPVAVFGGDYVASGSFTNGPAAYIIDVSGTTTASGTATTGTGMLSYDVGPDGLGYEIEARDIAADLTSSEIPFPLQLQADAYGFALNTPLAPTDAPAPVGLSVDLSGITINDEIWAMFDPAGNLPRDPATLRLDLSGAAKLDVAVTDPDQADELAENPGFPGSIESLTLNELTLDAIGVTVNGTGAFTFDNDDRTTFDGIPNPDGQITLDLTGANRLIDNLIAMGVVPADQAMMGRMMIGMFAKPTGEDSLQSVIEVRDGQVMANGQRIR